MSVSKVNIMERVRHLTIKIYRKMLCITRDLDGTKNITIDGVDLLQFRPFSWTPRNRIVLSCALLQQITMEGRIPFSFTNFITTPELSGPFYISPDIYHTQITEYSLLTFYEWALFSASKIFLIVIILDVSNFLLASKWIASLWITSPVLFQLKIFLIYSNQFLQNPLYVITLPNWSSICWKLLLSGLG